jgi:protein SCO1/2
VREQEKWRTPAPGKRVRWYGSLALALAVLAIAPYSSSAAAQPGQPPANSGTVQNRSIPPAIAQLPLTNQQGQTFTLGSFAGKTVMVVPFLTLCSDICPMTTGNLVQVERSLRHDNAASKVQIVEVSVDPGRDTPSRLAAYAQVAGVNWQLATETPAELAQLSRFFGFFYQQVPQGNPPAIDWLTGKPLTYDVNHSDGYVLVNPQGREVFDNAATPSFHGKLPAKLQHFLSAQGVQHLKNPPHPDWTPSDALAALGWVVGKPLPSSY